MKNSCWIILLLISKTIYGHQRIAIGRDTVAFSPLLQEKSLKKKVELKREIILTSPFHYSMPYDTTQLKIFEYKFASAPGDSISEGEIGILSERWGVKEGKGGRYLNLSDLKKLGNRKIDLAAIRFWITGGFEVKSKTQFRNYCHELKLAGITGKELPADFQVSEQKDIQDFHYMATTVLVDFKSIKFHYLVSPKNEVMLVKKEVLAEVKQVKVIPNPIHPGQFYLANPADSSAEKKELLYRDITEKYKDRILE
jgi:hypothetical protein